MKFSIYEAHRRINKVNFILKHYINAVHKHPKFCTKLLDSDNIRNYVCLDKVSHDCCEMYGSAESVLFEEVAEVLLAISQNDKKHAIYECYDAIAVLLRIVDELEKQTK